MAVKSPIRMKPEVIKREHWYAAAVARGAFAHDRAVCPRCGSGSLLPTGERELRRCDECGSSVSLDELAGHHEEWLSDNAHQRQDHFRRSARVLMRFAALGLALSAAGSLYAGSSQMVVAAVLLAVPVLAGAFAMRYRAWQAATGRFYEAQAPFGDFMRDELRGLISGRG